MSILAGMIIALGGTVYLIVSNLEGACLFAVGLLAVLAFNLHLFTGKAGLLATNDISFGKLFEIWIGNFIGTFAVAFGLIVTPKGEYHAEKAMQIVNMKITNGFLTNLVYGIFCGMLMYIAVRGYQLTGQAIIAILPVIVFIMCGFNHCVADMFYLHLSNKCYWIHNYGILFPITIGNIIGCCIIPWFKDDD